MSQKMKKVGKIKEAHGLRGDFFVLIFSKDVSWLSELQKFALGPDGPHPSLQEFQVEKAKPFKEGLMLKAQGISDRTQAEKYKGLMFYIPEELLESEKGETIYLSEIDGFEIVDPQGEKLGVIKGFSSNLAQDLLVVEKNDGDHAEIPFVEAFIVGIDFDSRQIRMDLPEGIWDLKAL